MNAIVVVPTFNERENLAELIPAILAADPQLDILIVDDNSPDGTGVLAEELALTTDRIGVLHRPGKLGLGAAYRAGFRQALDWGYEAICAMDADLSHNPADLPRLLAPVRDGSADLVLGARWIAGGGTRNWPLHRQLLSRCGSFYARTILDLPLHDLTGGFKCFRRQVLEMIDLDTIQARGYGFQIELTWRAVEAGFAVAEVPIIFSERIVGQSKMSAAIVAEALALVWKLRFDSGAAARPSTAPQPTPTLAIAEPLLEREVGR